MCLRAANIPYGNWLPLSGASVVPSSWPKPTCQYIIPRLPCDMRCHRQRAIRGVRQVRIVVATLVMGQQCALKNSWYAAVKRFVLQGLESIIDRAADTVESVCRPMNSRNRHPQGLVHYLGIHHSVKLGWSSFQVPMQYLWLLFVPPFIFPVSLSARHRLGSYRSWTMCVCNSYRLFSLINSGRLACNLTFVANVRYLFQLVGAGYQRNSRRLPSPHGHSSRYGAATHLGKLSIFHLTPLARKL